MSEQPKRNEMWLEERDGKRRHLVELREGESIIGPEERAVIEAAEVWFDVPILAQRKILSAAVSAMRKARKGGEQ